MTAIQRISSADEAFKGCDLLLNTEKKKKSYLLLYPPSPPLGMMGKTWRTSVASFAM